VAEAREVQELVQKGLRELRVLKVRPASPSLVRGLLVTWLDARVAVEGPILADR